VSRPDRPAVACARWIIAQSRAASLVRVGAGEATMARQRSSEARSPHPPRAPTPSRIGGRHRTLDPAGVTSACAVQALRGV